MGRFLLNKLVFEQFIEQGNQIEVYISHVPLSILACTTLEALLYDFTLATYKVI